VAQKTVRNVKRVCKARKDATVGAITRQMAKDYGLPKGSIRLVGPRGRKARSDKQIGSLRESWKR